MGLPLGRSARVRVPATSANLGPGFDCLGLALDWYDELEATVVTGEHQFEITGEGAHQVPRDASHLVVKSLWQGLESLGASVDAVRLVAHNTIPHSRGLGSSAAAIVAGLALAHALARPDEALDTAWLCEHSSRLEGHPDNACAAVLGGLVLAWQEVDYRVVELAPVPEVRTLVWVPGFEVPTSGARDVLPARVARTDAVLQASRSALLVHAITREPEHLLTATEDLLHQPYRAALMQPSAALVSDLRSLGVPAVVSGAGPTVLALGTPGQLAAAAQVPAEGFVRHDLRLGHGVALLTPR